MNDDFYKICFEQASVGLALCRRSDGKLEVVNQAFADILGWTREEVIALDYWQITPLKYKRKEQEQLRQLDARGAYGPYEKEYIHKNKKLIPVRLRGRMLTIDGQKYIWSLVEDLSKEKYRILFQQALIGLALCDMEGTLIDANQSLADMLGRPVEELEGMNYWQLTPKYYEQQELDRLKELKKRDAYGPYSKHFIHKNGQLIPVTLNGLMVTIEGVYYIWSIIEPGIFGGSVPPDETGPIEPLAPTGADDPNLIGPIKPIDSMENPANP